MKILNTLLLILVLAINSCGSPPDAYYYLIAKKTEVGPEMAMTVTLVKRFEKENWCLSETESFDENSGFKAECLFDEQDYAPMFEGEPVGKWYAIQRMGAFPPSVVFYEFKPPLSDKIMEHQLKRGAPHILQFAALHKAPAEVRIFSPEGEVTDEL